jgi:hypothetical protein
MANPQSLFDTLAGGFGHGVDRPGLNAFVANSQSINGLRTAQTEEALTNAQKQQEEMQAHADLENSLASVKGDDGQPLLTPSAAHLQAKEMIGHFGDAKSVMQAYREAQQAHNTGIISNPANLNTPQMTAAIAGNTNKAPEAAAVPNEYSVPAGMTPPVVHQTPLGAAETTEHLAGAKQKTANGSMDPNAIEFGAYQLYKTGKMPTLGMGGGPARNQILTRASQLAQQEQQTPGSTSNPAFDTAIANGQDFTAGGRALNNFAGGPISTQVRSLNNVVGHLSLMENLFSALQNGDMQAFNSVKAGWKKQFGSEAPTDVQTAAQVIGPELTKILTNTGAGTGPEREHFAETAGNLANSPEQVGGAIGTLKGMLGRQAADYALQYHGATGRSDFASRYLQPDVAAALDLGPEAQQQHPGAQVPAAGGPSVAAAPVKVANDADWAKLAPGTHFVGPDGHVRVK